MHCQCMLFVATLFVCMVHSVPGRFSMSLPCRTNARCTILPDCATFNQFIASLQKPLKPSIVQFLRSQECGFGRGYPKVCCINVPQTLYPPQRQTPAPPNKAYVNISASVDQGSELHMVIDVNTGETTTEALKLKKKRDRMKSHFMKMMYEELTMFDLMMRQKRSDFSVVAKDLEIR